VRRKSGKCLACDGWPYDLTSRHHPHFLLFILGNVGALNSGVWWGHGGDETDESEGAMAIVRSGVRICLLSLALPFAFLFSLYFIYYYFSLVWGGVEEGRRGGGSLPLLSSAEI